MDNPRFDFRQNARIISLLNAKLVLDALCLPNNTPRRKWIFPWDKAAGVTKPPLILNYSREQECVELYLQSPICLHGVHRDDFKIYTLFSLLTQLT